MKHIQYPEDCKQIQKVLLSHEIYADLKECEELWLRYSDSMCAGWMFLPETNDEIWNCICDYISIE